jgi:hypothetical protein
VFAACEPDAPPPPEPPPSAVNPTDALAEHLRGTGNVDPSVFALATPPADPRPVRTLGQVKEALKLPEAKAATAALKESGMSDEEMAQLVTLSTAYNSGSVLDPLRAERVRLNEEVTKDFAKLDEAIVAAEAKSGVPIDRNRLLQRLFDLPGPKGPR